MVIGKKKGVDVYDTMPQGWKEVTNAQTAPIGYIWISNNKSHFCGERKSALLLEKGVIAQ